MIESVLFVCLLGIIFGAVGRAANELFMDLFFVLDAIELSVEFKSFYTVNVRQPNPKQCSSIRLSQLRDIFCR